MAKTKGPLYSQSATGKLGPGLFFAKTPGGHKACKLTPPTNPNSELQILQRQIMGYAVLSWQNLSPAQKETFDELATQLGLQMSGYNYYISGYFSDFEVGPPPEWEYPPGLVSRWGLNEIAAGPVINSVDPTAHGVNHDAIINQPGRVGTCYEFDGSISYINVPDNSVFNCIEYNHAFSLGCWIKISTVALSDFLLCKSPGAALNYRGPALSWYYFETGKIQMLLDLRHTNTPTNLIQVYCTLDFIGLTDWIHIFVTYDGSVQASGVKIYIDGAPGTLHINANNLSDTIITNADFFMAKPAWGTGYYDGLIDEVVLFDRELTEAEVLNIYDEQKP